MRQYKFSVEEIKQRTKGMVILVDSREKKNSHILDYFRKQKIAYRVEKTGIWGLQLYDSLIGSRRGHIFSPELRGGAQGNPGGIKR